MGGATVAASALLDPSAHAITKSTAMRVARRFLSAPNDERRRARDVSAAARCSNELDDIAFGASDDAAAHARARRPDARVRDVGPRARSCFANERSRMRDHRAVREAACEATGDVVEDVRATRETS